VWVFQQPLREDLVGVRVEKIITLASKRVELQVQVFVRSLRKVGCELSVWAIPCRERDFELTSGRWLEKWPFVIRLLKRLVGLIDGRFHVQPTL
jgi:hypothetical protein